MSVSAYWNGSGAPPYQGLMRNGEYTRPGAAACGSQLFARRAVLYVEGIGFVQCLDTGGGITEGHIDLWMPTEAEAIEWGRKQMDVVILRGRE
jgi:3D (Asp-Asp-Asp) domain-containing protein